MSIVTIKLQQAVGTEAAAIHHIFMPTLSAGAESYAAAEAANTVTAG